MRDTIASDDGHLSTELMVREFRQVILYPLQLVPVEGQAKTQANWERLMGGRYGPYLTDGTTNGTLPRDKQPQGAQEGSGEGQESGAEEEGCG